MTAIQISVVLNGVAVPVEREVFAALFEHSVVSDRAAVRKALESSTIPFKTLIDLARRAEIPYPLFFAPLAAVEAQLKVKTDKLMAGFTKASFSMHSRNAVRLADVELIVKDLLRKQELLKADGTLTNNEVIGCLKKSRGTVAEDAARLMDVLGFTTADLKGAKTKQAALELLIARLEAKQILVARSAKNYMPQQVPRQAKFSGMTIKDRKIPYVFLASGDEGDHLEPTGRKIFTLTLLTVLIARGTFAPVTYDGHSKDESSPREYELTAQILMPADDLSAHDVSSLERVKEVAEVYKVSPSAIVMRMRRLGALDRDTAGLFMDELAEEYASRPKQRMSSALPVNALRKYNGTECSRRMLRLLDAGQIQPADFCRIMFFNKLKPSHIDDFRLGVR